MNLLGPFRFESLMHPWVLLILVAVAALFVAEVTARAPGAMTISTGAALARAAKARRRLLRWLPAVLRAVALALLVVALARPLQGLTPRKDRANVIDIMLCVDVSGSMLALDRGFTYQGELQNRLYVVKRAVERFVQSRKYRKQDRFGLDRVGLILYAGYAWTQCPLTLDYAILEHELELAEVDETNREKQGTAIGSAIGLAVNRLRNQ